MFRMIFPKISLIKILWIKLVVFMVSSEFDGLGKSENWILELATELKHGSQLPQQTAGSIVSENGTVNALLVKLELPFVQGSCGSNVSEMDQLSAENLYSICSPPTKDMSMV